MQILLTSLIVFIAALYAANRWIPHNVKKQIMHMFGGKITTQPKEACGSCSSCGNCESTLTTLSKETATLHYINITDKS